MPLLKGFRQATARLSGSAGGGKPRRHDSAPRIEAEAEPE